MKNDKYEFLYNYARSSFDDELQRFKNIEDKASKYISLFSILIVGFTALIRFSGSSLLEPKKYHRLGNDRSCIDYIYFFYIIMESVIPSFKIYRYAKTPAR